MANILLKRTCRIEHVGSPDPRGFHTWTSYYYDNVTKQSFVNVLQGRISCAVYSRPITEKIDDYCEGSDGIEVYHDGNGGVTLVTIDDGCASEVCDIFFHMVTPNSDLGKVSFNVSKTPYEFSLNNFIDFETSTTGFNAINDLVPGDYVLKVRDANNKSCVATHEFTIEEIYTYSLKWFFEYYDLNEVLTRVEILGKNFEGVASEIKYIDPNPVIIDWKGKGSDKYRSIVPSECILNVISKQDFEYITLFSSDEKEHKVDIYKNGSVFWKGFIMPDVYNEPYVAPPYNMTVSAVDGLATLDSYQYELVEDKVNLLDVVRYCLKKIGHDIKIYDATFILPNIEDSGSGLQKNYAKNKAFKGLNCYEVLERVLFSQASRISQVKGKWHIVPIDALIGEYKAREFNMESSSLTPVSTVDPVIEIGDIRQGEPFFMRAYQALTIKPAYKELKLTYDYGLNDQLIKNNEFEGEFENKIYREENGEEKDIISFVAPISQTIQVDPTSDPAKLELDIEYRVTETLVYTAPSIEFAFYKLDELSNYPGFTIEIKLNGEYYVYRNVGYDIPAHREKPATQNADEFIAWLAPHSNNYTFGKYSRSGNFITPDPSGNIVKIQAKSNDLGLDFGDVNIESKQPIVEITARNNVLPDISTNTFGLRIYAYDIGGNEKTLTENSHWVDAYQDWGLGPLIPNTIYLPLGKDFKWQTFSTITEALPDRTETIKIVFLGFQGKTGNKENQLKKMSVLFLPLGQKAPKESVLEIKNPSKSLTFTPPDYKLFLGSEPVYDFPFGFPNSVNIFNNTLYYKFGDDFYPFIYFKIGDGEHQKLSDIIGKLIFANNYRPVQVITGTLRGNFTINNSFVDQNNPGRIFIINSMKYHDRKKEYDVELVEMLSGYDSSNAILLESRLLETGGYRLLEDGTVRMLEGYMLTEDGFKILLEDN